MNPAPLLIRAAKLHGKLYAELLKADSASAQRERETGTVPQAWRDKRRRMGRALDEARREFSRELARARNEFWRKGE